MRVHLDKVQDIGGFALGDGQAGDQVEVLHKAAITSDDSDFYTYIDHISNVFLANTAVNAIHQFLVLIHKDLSADLYVNDFQVALEIRPKRDLQKGQVIGKGDIADIQRLSFPDIEMNDTDKVVYCFKVGWKFGLFFDLDRAQEKLDVAQMSLDLGTLCRYLMFQDVYKVLASQVQFEEMIRDGWFPFIEILGTEYKTLGKIYENRFDFENRVRQVVGRFDGERIHKMANRWWSIQVFKEHQSIIMAGIDAYLQEDDAGFINCIKNLLSEAEGVIRRHYFQETGKSRPTFQELLDYVVEKGKAKTASSYSLFMPLHFFKYLNDVVFAEFDLKAGKLSLSRHTSGHGVASAGDYTRIRALQTILVLDQLNFFIQ